MDESLVGAFRDHALLIENAEHTIRLVLNKVKHGLIVLKLDVNPLDLLLGVLLLLHFENVAIEELLDFLVGVVDAKLLEAVFLKILKSKNIQQSDETVRIWILQQQNGKRLGGEREEERGAWSSDRPGEWKS